MTHDANDGMTDEQLLRYSRHILLDELGVEGQQRLTASHAGDHRDQPWRASMFGPCRGPSLLESIPPRAGPGESGFVPIR